MVKMNKKIKAIEFVSNGNLYDLRLQEIPHQQMKVRKYKNTQLEEIIKRPINDPGGIVVLLQSLEMIKHTDYIIKSIEFEKYNSFYELRLQDLSNGSSKVRVYKDSKYIAVLDKSEEETKSNLVLIKALVILNTNEGIVV